MGKVQVVVDSTADFAMPSVIERYQITVVPHYLHFGRETYLDRQQMGAEAFFKRAGQEDVYPTISPPSTEQFQKIYAALNKETDQIISLHMSRSFSNAWHNAQEATRNLLGRCDIAVIDTLTTSAGLGILAELAARAAEQTTSLDEIVRLVRGAMTRVYSIFFVDRLNYICQNGLIGEAQAILGGMLGIKPFLTIEDGELVTMEKVRTRTQAIDKLIEFVMEFNSIDQLIILQNSPYATETVRALQDRLATELGRKDYPIMMYGPAVATFLGLDATGIVVLEKEDF